jgi:hypothetical protein
MVLRSIVGGWQVSGITTWQSGTPVNVTITGDIANTGTGSQRPNLVGPVPELNCQPNTSGATQDVQRRLINCYDQSAFALPAQFTFGNAGRNILRGPNSLSTDLSLMKNFVIHGDTRFQFRVEMYNVFNNVNYNNPGATVANPNFGVITGADAMRRIQLGGKLIF